MWTTSVTSDNTTGGTALLHQTESAPGILSPLNINMAELPEDFLKNTPLDKVQYFCEQHDIEADEVQTYVNNLEEQVVARPNLKRKEFYHQLSVCILFILYGICVHKWVHVTHGNTQGHSTSIKCQTPMV